MLKRRYRIVFRRRNGKEIESKEFSSAHIKRLMQIMIGVYKHEVFSLSEIR